MKQDMIGMTPLDLETELAKIDMKFSNVENAKNPYDFLDFFIRLCSPKAVEELEFDDEGIVVCIHRFKRDRTGTNRLAVLQDVYPFSLSGLESAREDALRAATDLYSLPQDIQVVDVNYVPVPKEGFDFNKIYRVPIIKFFELYRQAPIRN